MIFNPYMPNRQHPRYPWPTPPAWKQKVLRRLEELDITKADLARRVHTTTANMSILLEGATKSSELVPDIHKVLSWPAPQSYWDDERDLLKAEIDAHWGDLNEDERALVHKFIELSKKRKPGG